MPDSRRHYARGIVRLCFSPETAEAELATWQFRAKLLVEEGRRVLTFARRRVILLQSSGNESRHMISLKGEAGHMPFVRIHGSAGGRERSSFS